MSPHSRATRAPSVFVASEEAHLELIKLRDHTRLLSRMADPTTVRMHECPVQPRALAWSYAAISRALDEYLQATHWSEDPALDIEEAHARAADIRERNWALRGEAGE